MELDQMPVEHLEREITELAAHINAATCRWLLLVGEFDRREAWAEWGAKSCVHWLSARCGIGPTAAREQVRVARRLAEFPAIRDRFEQGELSYSQVRALTRVATPEIEEELLTVARHATGAQLEVLVRAYRGVLATELETVRRAHENRYLVHSHEDDGSLVIRARLPAEEGALVLAALEAGRDALREGARGASAEAPPSPDDPPREDASAEAPTIPDDPQRQGASAEAPVGRPSVSNADALVLMAETLLASGPSRGDAAERHQVVVHVDAATLSDEGDGTCQLDEGAALHPETARRLACDASLVRIIERDGRPLSVGRKTRTISPALKRALRSRDGGCRFPGCTERRFVDAHHIEHWARGGKTALGNLVHLCRRHHRLVHEGGYAIERGAAGAIAFRRPDGRLILKAPRLRGGDRRELIDRNGRADLQPDHETCVPEWFGDRLNLVYEVDGLVARDRRLMEPVPT
jgi:hypothetical protein